MLQTPKKMSVFRSSILLETKAFHQKTSGKHLHQSHVSRSTFLSAKQSKNNIHSGNESLNKDEKSSKQTMLKQNFQGFSRFRDSLSGVMSSVPAFELRVPDFKRIVSAGAEKIQGDVNKVSDSIREKQQLVKKRKMQKKMAKESAIPTEKSSESLLAQIEDMNSSILSYYNVSEILNDPKDSEGNFQPIPMSEKDAANSTNNAPNSTSVPGKESVDFGKWKNLNYRTLLNQFSLSSQPDTVDKEQKKMLVRKEFVSKQNIEKKTNELVLLLQAAVSKESILKRTHQFSEHLLRYPDTRQGAVRMGVMKHLLKMQASTGKDNSIIQQEIAQALSLIGYVNPPRGRGITILTVDGGGTRGLLALQTLREIEKICGKPIYTLFDYVSGVSTGSLILAILFLFRKSISECEELYIECSREMFTRAKTLGFGKLVLDHSFYDSDLWEKILLERMGEKTLIEFSKDPACAKMSAISSLTNVTKLKNYMFRTYNLPPGVFSQYPGHCKHKVWECIRASSAAPGYYKPFILDDYTHQDGGILTNNPTAVAVHECRLLWPDENIQCVVSLGNGRYEPNLTLSSSAPSTKKQLINIIDSATDTEAVHTILNDLLPPRSYYRFNPYMTEDVQLNEIKPEVLNQMKQDGRMYLRKNGLKLQRACRQLLLDRRPIQKFYDKCKVEKIKRSKVQ